MKIKLKSEETLFIMGGNKCWCVTGDNERIISSSNHEIILQSILSTTKIGACTPINGISYSGSIAYIGDGFTRDTCKIQCRDTIGSPTWVWGAGQHGACL